MKKWLVSLAFVLIGLPLVFIVIGATAFGIANRSNGSLISSGEQRRYLLYVPDSYDPSEPTPLVISIHGFAEWPAHQMRISGWNALADQYGFLVVYPMGTDFPLRWRATGGEAYTPVDVIFIGDLINKLAGEYNIDPARIYANGLSNGGGMSFLLACKLSERIAAIGTVSGAYLLPWEECDPTRPVPAVVFHGTADPIVPYQGGPSHAFDLPFPVITQWVDILAQRNGCDPNPRALPPSGVVSGLEYTNCQADLVYYTIAGGGHSWPGGEPLPELLTGITTQDIDATAVMWEFFQVHPMQTP